MISLNNYDRSGDLEPILILWLDRYCVTDGRC